jgi:hypothetical protein
LSPERLISPYVVLGTMVSGRKQSGGGGRSHLVFGGRGEAAARTRYGGFLSSKLGDVATSSDGCLSKVRGRASPEDSSGASCPGGGAPEAAEQLGIGND